MSLTFVSTMAATAEDTVCVLTCIPQCWQGEYQLLLALVGPLPLCGLSGWLHTLDCDHAAEKVLYGFYV